MSMIWRHGAKRATGLSAASPAALIPAHFGLSATIPCRGECLEAGVVFNVFRVDLGMQRSEKQKAESKRQKAESLCFP